VIRYGEMEWFSHSAWTNSKTVFNIKISNHFEDGRNQIMAYWQKIGRSRNFAMRLLEDLKITQWQSSDLCVLMNEDTLSDLVSAKKS
jgi:hypothetical protein